MPNSISLVAVGSVAVGAGGGNGEGLAVLELDGEAVVGGDDAGREEVHGRAADEAGDEAGGGVVVELLRAGRPAR